LRHDDHDYKRNGNDHLFAALETLQEGSLANAMQDTGKSGVPAISGAGSTPSFPATSPLHLIMDNYGTHSTQSKSVAGNGILGLFLTRPHQFQLDDLVERWFGHLATRPSDAASSSACRPAGVHSSFPRCWNQHPKPFVWTATVEFHQEKLSRAAELWSKSSPGCTTAIQKNEKNVPVSYLQHYTSVPSRGEADTRSSVTPANRSGDAKHGRSSKMDRRSVPLSVGRTSLRFCDHRP